MTKNRALALLLAIIGSGFILGSFYPMQPGQQIKIMPVIAGVAFLIAALLRFRAEPKR